MADPARITKTGGYVVLQSSGPRITKTGGYIVEGLGNTRRVTKTGGYAVESLGVVCGTAPHLGVSGLESTSVDLTIDALPEYLESRFEVFQGDTLVLYIIKTSNIYIQPVSGLTPSTTYTAYARVKRDCGWSPRSDAVTFTTPSGELPGITRGCPPASRGWVQNPDVNPPTHFPLGFFKPLPGEPLSGTEEVVFRWDNNLQNWDFDISDDLGVSWSPVTTGVTYVGDPGDFDGDQLYRYKFSLDTTLLTDGVDYLLRARSALVGDDTEIITASFAIDNGGNVRWWEADDNPLSGRFAALWNQTGSGHPALPPGTIWVRGLDGGIAGFGNQGWAGFADRNIPDCKGGDVTVRFYIWSGEGGIFALQGRDDTELFNAGIGFQILGTTSPVGRSSPGFVVVVRNGISGIVGCCDDYLTSGTAEVRVGIPSSDEGLMNFLQIDGGGGAVAAGVPSIGRMFFKALRNPFFNPIGDPSPTLIWRNGPNPGDFTASSDKTCGRRYEVYSLRCRAEVNAGDDTLMDLKIRLHGDGVEPPASGYWHFEDTVQLGASAQCGFLSMVSQQLNLGVWGPPNGARVFMSWSALPLDICDTLPTPEPPPEPVEFPVADPAVSLEVDCERVIATASLPPEAVPYDQSRWVFTDSGTGEILWDTEWQSDSLTTLILNLVEDFDPDGPPFEGGQFICVTVKFRVEATLEESSESAEACALVPNLLDEPEVNIESVSSNSITIALS